MHFALVTDVISRGLFIQKGLKCEDIASRLITNISLLNSYQVTQDYDGLLIVSDNPEQYHDFCDKLLEQNNNFVFVLFSSFTLESIHSFLKHHPYFEYYSDPYPFRKISFNLRTKVYALREKISNDTLFLREISLDVGGHTVKICNKTVYFRNKEFSLLRYFMTHPGKLLSRNTILEDVWDRNTDFLTNTVDVHVSQLRKKIRKHTGEDYIKTVPCLGYVFE